MCLSVYEGLLLSMWVHFSRIVPPCGAHIRHMQVMGGGKYHSDQIILTTILNSKFNSFLTEVTFTIEINDG